MVRDVVVRDSDGNTIDLIKQEAEQSETNSGAKKTLSTGDFLIQRIAYNGNNLTEYVGFAKPGTATDSEGWLIKKLTYSGNLVVSILFANGNLQFDSAWDDRETESYS